MNWLKTPCNSYELCYVFRLKEEKSIETSSYAWIDASFDQYYFHGDSAFEFDWDLVIQSWPVVLRTNTKKFRYSERPQSLFGPIFQHIHLTFIDQNGMMWLSEDAGQKIGQGQSTPQSLILSIFCIPSSVTGIPLGTSVPSAYGNQGPLLQLYKPIELQNIDISQYSENVMDNDQPVHQKMLS